MSLVRWHLWDKSYPDPNLPYMDGKLVKPLIRLREVSKLNSDCRYWKKCSVLSV